MSAKIFDDRPVSTWKRKWLCGEGSCSGEMRFSGLSRHQSFESAHQHSCSSCERIEWDDDVYPKITHREI